MASDCGGGAKLLTPGECEVEQWSFSTDRETVFFNSNCGDIDRRHLWSVVVAGGAAMQQTHSQGIEWSPLALADKNALFYIASDAQHASRVFRTSLSGDRTTEALTAIPAGFPADQLVTPQQVIFRAADGVEIHGQLFVPRDGKAGEKHPGLVFMHGGSMRQMLLGWHYMYYYSNSYAMNQYLANHGYVVLSVNYRSGIGYGRAFREAPGRAWTRGDVSIAMLWRRVSFFAGASWMLIRRVLGCGAGATVVS